MRQIITNIATITEEKMKATGIVRKLDELGRIVIPKELRKTLRLKTGEGLEIFTGDDGSLTLKKYSAFENIYEHAQIYAESLSGASSFTVIVTDTQRIIAAAYKGSRIAFGKAPLTDAFYNHITGKSRAAGEQSIQITGDLDAPPHLKQTVAPIISNGDSAGSVVIYCEENDIKCAAQSAQVAAVFFNKLISD